MGRLGLRNFRPSSGQRLPARLHKRGGIKTVRRQMSKLYLVARWAPVIVDSPPATAILWTDAQDENCPNLDVYFPYDAIAIAPNMDRIAALPLVT